MNPHRVNTATGLKMWFGTRPRLRSAASVVALLPFLGAALTGGALAGDALYTTTQDGTAVNANIYATSTDVYISGGPQNKNAAGLPDGTYYFQVTDPSGGTLLSTDAAICRQVQVVGGHINGSIGPALCKHTNGTLNPANGTLPVELFPFLPTPNAGNEYEAWLVPTTAASVSASDSAVLIFSPSDAKTDNFKVQTAINPNTQASCQSAGSLGALVSGTSVVAYVPKGAWDNFTTGVSVVNVEGTNVSPTLIPTANAVNSCAANSVTGQTVCTANNTDVYLLSGTSLSSTLTSGGSGSIFFSGGPCTNCNVGMDAVHNKAVIGLSVGGAAGFQVLDLGTSTFGTAFPSPALEISEGPMVDPTRNVLLSADENGVFEIIDLSTSPLPSSHVNTPPVSTGGLELDSTAEDCSTAIALAPGEFSQPSQVFIADLTQATLAPGTWTAPATASQVQTLGESFLSAGASGIAVAQGTHIGVITGEFGGDAVTAIKLPATSRSGTPAISDWVTCSIGNGFNNGDDPHTVTAYKSPTTGDAIAVLANEGASFLAVVDLTKMLDPTIVPRTGSAGNACTPGPGGVPGDLPAAVVSFIAVP
jgi:hypothetical protein